MRKLIVKTLTKELAKPRGVRRKTACLPKTKKRLTVKSPRTIT